MPSISAVVNIRNEERNISKCLDCLIWCDEIVVVDMESEDNSVEIARSYTSQVFTFPKVGYVEPARKFAVEQTTGDWVLIVDADELIPFSLKNKLTALVIEEKDVDVVYIPRKNYIMGDWIRYTGWWPDYQPRFFRKGMIDFTDQIHIGTKVNDDARKLFLTDIDENGIEHFSYFNADHFVTKLNAYTNVEAKHLFDNGSRFGLRELFLSSAREFYNRLIKTKGYKDGYRGFFLCLMMGFYRTLTYIKLWENWQYKDVPVEVNYNELKDKIIKKYSDSVNIKNEI